MLLVFRLYSTGDGMINEYGATDGMRTNRRNQSPHQKRVPVPLYPPKIKYDFTWDRTQAGN
jgi:hypothetical protein